MFKPASVVESGFFMEKVMEERPIAIIVDDSKPFLLYMTLLLSRLNLEVLPADNAAEALEVARITPPNLILLDLVMPEMDGLAALREIRADKDLFGVAVIMVSGYRQKHLQWEALSMGCIDVLEKPIELRRLHKAIQDCNPFPSGRRRYLRAPFGEDVVLHHRDRSVVVPSVTLSERGMFLHMQDHLPRNTPVDIEIPLPCGGTLRAGGSVVYRKDANHDKRITTPGIAVKFNRLTESASKALAELVENLLIGDIVSEQTEPILKPG